MKHKKHTAGPPTYREAKEILMGELTPDEWGGLTKEQQDEAIRSLIDSYKQGYRDGLKGRRHG